MHLVEQAAGDEEDSEEWETCSGDSCSEDWRPTTPHKGSLSAPHRGRSVQRSTALHENRTHEPWTAVSSARMEIALTDAVNEGLVNLMDYDTPSGSSAASSDEGVAVYLIEDTRAPCPTGLRAQEHSQEERRMPEMRPPTPMKTRDGSIVEATSSGRRETRDNKTADGNNDYHEWLVSRISRLERLMYGQERVIQESRTTSTVERAQRKLMELQMEQAELGERLALLLHLEPQACGRVENDHNQGVRQPAQAKTRQHQLLHEEKQPKPETAPESKSCAWDGKTRRKRGAGGRRRPR